MSRFSQWIDAWIARRSPAAQQVSLTNKNIYIFPSRTGWLFLWILFVLLLTAINYQNSLVFGLCFWLGSVFAVLIWHTWKNLSSITVSTGEEVAGFIGDQVMVGHELSAKDRHHHHSLKIEWKSSESLTVSSNYDRYDVVGSHSSVAYLPFRISQRGWNKTPRVEISGRYPIGVLTAWSILQLDQPILGYPIPVFDVKPQGSDGAEKGDEEQETTIFAVKQSGSDFDSLAPYIQGDSLKKIDWKRFAKTDELVSKSFVSSPSSTSWLDFDAFEGLDVEARLSAMAGWIVRWSELDRPFGLRLSGVTIDPATGLEHKYHCLRALALYGQTEQSFISKEK